MPSRRSGAAVTTIVSRYRCIRQVQMGVNGWLAWIRGDSCSVCEVVDVFRTDDMNFGETLVLKPFDKVVKALGFA
jgi:hypothetical protein